MEKKGWTIWYIPWEDLKGRPKVLKRFKPEEEAEKDHYLDQIYSIDSGFTPEELQTITIEDDYNYHLSF